VDKGRREFIAVLYAGNAISRLPQGTDPAQIIFSDQVGVAKENPQVQLSCGTNETGPMPKSVAIPFAEMIALR
jgi:hypothetical protein